ncbi:MAG: uncharacterized protein A8A55_2628 [Amphiamblys sp. WSBS2006]|nr:MAG: uncharacterized protein A8A55_2628 [Amphiamblys sp. WSBS2006]
MDDFFGSFLRKKFAKVKKTLREDAAVSARENTVEQLQVHYRAAETRRSEARDREELLAAARQEVEEYKIALTARRAWEKLSPYKKQFSFRPFEAGDNLDKLPQLQEQDEMNDDGVGGLSLEDVLKVYGPWKEQYDRFIRRHEEAPEKEQQTKFSRFLEFFNIELGDVRKFYKLGKYERDIRLEPVGKKDFSFVEIKAIYKTDKSIQEVLEAALYRAAMYVVLACIMHPMPIKKTVEPPQATRHYKKRITAIALPVLVSRFGVVEFDLDENGKVTNFTIAAGKNVIWKETDESLKEKLQDTWDISFAAAKKHVKEAAATRIANNIVQSLIKKHQEEQQKLVETGCFVLVPEKEAAHGFLNYVRRCLVGINTTKPPVNE